MAKVNYTPDARVLVGIDISKHRHEVLIAVPGKTRRRQTSLLLFDYPDYLRLGETAFPHLVCSLRFGKL